MNIKDRPQPLLSILICTLPERAGKFAALRGKLWCQAEQEAGPTFLTENVIEILWDDRGRGEISTGFKRNDLLRAARGKMIVFLDDDDDICDQYIKLNLHCIRQNPDVDCIAIDGWITTDGGNKRAWKIDKNFGSWYERDGVYYRTPNHISPVKRSIALFAGFPDQTTSEDYDYSMRILPHLKTQAAIAGDIYYYLESTNK